MKRIRIPFYLLMAVCLFGGWITGLRVWFIAFIAQVCLLLASLGLNLWTALSFAYTQEPVSYTHLDVYKRQVPDALSWGLRKCDGIGHLECTLCPGLHWIKD